MVLFSDKKDSSNSNDQPSDIEIRAIQNFQQGRYAEAESLWRESLKYSEEKLGAEHPEFAKKLGVLGEILSLIGDTISAENYFLKSYKILLKNYGEHHEDVAAAITNLGNLLYQKGDYAGAVAPLRKALEIFDKSGVEHHGMDNAVHNLASTLQILGRYAEAAQLYRRSYEICINQYGNKHPEVAVTLGNIAGLETTLGNYTEAEKLYRESLGILQDNEKTLGAYHPILAEFKFELADILTRKSDSTETVSLFEDSLNLLQNLLGEDHPDVTRKMSRFAGMLHGQGKNKDAESLYRQVLKITKRRFGLDSIPVAITMNDLSMVLLELGNYDEAESLNHRSLGTLEEHFGPEHPDVAKSLMCLSKILGKMDRRPSAILCAKRAVNIYQIVRQDVNAIGIDKLNTYDISLESFYEHLATLLISEGRLGEAEHVMAMLKEKEFKELTRSDSLLENNAILFNKAEKPIIEKYDHISTEIHNVGEKVRTLKNNHNLSVEQNIALAEKEECLFDFKTDLSSLLKNIDNELPLTYISDSDQKKYKTIDLSCAIPNTAAITTVTSKHKFSTITTIADEQKSFSIEYNSVELSKKILKLRESLKDIDTDEYLSLAQELYAIIIQPIEQHLLDNKVQNIIWMLDGALRLLPLSALHDGKQFLVQKFNNTTITTASNNHRVNYAPWNGLGLGTAKEHEGYPGLSAVKDELMGIISQNGSNGIIPGKILLDEEFTKEAMQTNLAHDYSAVHFASHFVLNPVDDTASHLLLGDGSKMPMNELRESSELFKGVDIVSFSACSTGLGTTDKLGREVDGLGYLGERQGANTVIASLWPVDDSSTSLLMKEFYKTREASQTKAHALQSAQLGLLEGILISEEGHDFTHPFFWAPFVLIGNGS